MLTVLTPTYDRARTLPRLFDSLLRQDGVEFEWLVVDDGSTDGTAALIDEFAARAPFPVRRVFQANGGKHVAVNTGVAHASGGWIFIVDSDDWLADNALQVVTAALRPAEDDAGVVGLCFRKTDAQGRVLGRDCADLPVPWAGAPTDAGRRVRGELAYVFRREAMAAVPFPVIPGEKFVPDLYAWNRIGDLGAILFYLDRAIYRCEYLEDGYTRNFSIHLRRNPRGFFLFYAAQIRREPRFVDKIKAVARCAQCLAYQAIRRVRRDGAGG
jgi:glycosyltransferase involved in cell wall biosynthesis